MSVISEALKEIIGPAAHNGNGATNGNGHSKSPSERAWDTAREKAREQGQTVRDHEIRCIKTKGMSAWAKLLFWILSKICWESSDFLFEKRIGSVCITGPQLQRHFSFPEKRLYRQTKKVRDKKTKEVLASRIAPGAIEELIRAGFIWIGKKPIQNIPKNKWPNVFNLTALVSQREQQSLGLLEDVIVIEDEPKAGEVQTTDGGSSVFLPQNRNGSGQTPQNGPASDQREELAATNGGSGQPPRAGLGSNRREELAATDGGSSTATDGGSSPPPRAGLGSNRGEGLADPASGVPIKTSDVQDVQSACSDVSFKRSTGLNAINGSGGAKKLSAENIFLLDVGAMMERWKPGSSKGELDGSGAWWRLSYRDNPDLMRRILAEVTTMIKEGKIKFNPGSTAVDLFKRWGGIQGQRKQKAAGATAAK